MARGLKTRQSKELPGTFFDLLESVALHRVIGTKQRPKILENLSEQPLVP